MLGSIASQQCGSAFAAHVFPVLGVALTACLRSAVGGVALAAIDRPRLRGRSARDLLAVTLFGVLIASMNLSFYAAIDRIPLSLAVAIEFLGPLGVAVYASRRRVELLWVAIAAGGIVLFAGAPGSGVDAIGVACAVATGACWAAYIFVAKHVGRTWEGSQGVTVGLSVASVALIPVALVTTSLGTIDARTVLLICAVGAFAGALVFSLEVAALRKLPAGTYGVLASLEPAFAAVAGIALLGQSLSATQLCAILLVVIACVGAMRNPKAV
jgi:inner membrane transporter RhtA